MVTDRLARDLDPAGVQERKAHTLKRKNLPEYWPKSLLALRWLRQAQTVWVSDTWLHRRLEWKNHVAICGMFQEFTKQPTAYYLEAVEE